jgi:hypothetical protein
MKIGVMDPLIAGPDTLNQALGLIIKAFAGRNEYGHSHLASGRKIYIVNLIG